MIFGLNYNLYTPMCRYRNEFMVWTSNFEVWIQNNVDGGWVVGGDGLNKHLWYLWCGKMNGWVDFIYLEEYEGENSTNDEDGGRRRWQILFLNENG